MTGSGPQTDALTFARFDELPWTSPPSIDDLPPELIERARQVQRKGLVQGACGFYASHVTMPAGHVADPHHHDHSELFVILAGSMEFRAKGSSRALEVNDAVAIPAGETYGFTIGPDGVAFLLVRTGKAGHTMVTT
jgi:mannose-6-phosphate isomerase-like protein (cupin superfamily)